MRPFTQTIPFADALAIVMREAIPIARTETTPLAGAAHRVAARDVLAASDVPPFARAAMDGYAVVAADTAGASAARPCVIECVGRVFAGETAARAVGPGTCLEIATGAPMPPGADAVVMVEDTARTGASVEVRAQASAGQNIGRRGADLTAGTVVVHAGDLLTPARIGALAAVGVTAVEVCARPSIAVISTGDELVEPGRQLGPGQIYDVNRFTIDAIVRRHGGTTTAIAAAADDLTRLESALDTARAHDAIVFSGGSSVGDRDLVRTLLDTRGRMLFHGIAVKPGKPTAFAIVGRTPVFGMPGYPTSCLSNAYLLLLPFVRALAHLPRWAPRTVVRPLAARVASVGNRHQFFTVRITDDSAEPAFKASGDITSMANADGYIEIPVGVEAVEAGTIVDVTLFD